ncbi:hypothetical protein CIPAW_01G186900 [Carya illinoinensis]|uniref:Secreted protein n=1 Tax=Carya illinoinensis TaxID=32201 RepID=A0A8T1RPM5_CARIL|nr:hypothetical protein CIPAW_01G186900 [Carya illinoinensis]
MKCGAHCLRTLYTCVHLWSRLLATSNFVHTRSFGGSKDCFGCRLLQLAALLIVALHEDADPTYTCLLKDLKEQI